MTPLKFRPRPAAAALTALLALGSGAAQAQSILDSVKKALNPRTVLETAVPHCPSAADPSHVYGYIALVDPATGRTWIPYVLRGDWASPISVVNLISRFRSRSDNNVTAELRHESGAAIMSVRRGPDGKPDGIRYTIALRGDRNAGAPAVTEPMSSSVTIAYNPDQWCFDTILVNPINNSHGYQNLQPRPAGQPLNFPDAARCDAQNKCYDAAGTEIFPPQPAGSP